MASANVQLVSAILEDWGRGDYTAADWAHPDIEFVRMAGPAAETWTGLAGMSEGTRDWLNAWEDSRVEVDDVRELDDQRVLALVRVTGRGKESGLDLGRMLTESAYLFEFGDGLVTRFVHYLERERALAL